MGSRAHPGQVLAVILPPASGGAARSALCLRCRNSSCLTEAGERAGGGGGAWRSLHRLWRKTGAFAAALPLPWSPRARRARWCCGGPGRYGAGRRGSSGARIGLRLRAALGGWSLPLIPSGGSPVRKSVAEAPLAHSYGVLYCGARYMERGSVSGASPGEVSVRDRLWE